MLTEQKPVSLSRNAMKVLEKRYLAKDEEGHCCETVQDLFRRVAKTVASADIEHGKTEEEVAHAEGEFYDMMTALEFLPNSPTLMNAGRRLGQLSACFVLPVGDSIADIFDAVKHTTMIHKSGGGTGFSFSRLRPSGDVVGSTGGISSGPISFMAAFDQATETIKQGGTRRGANMGILRVDHPDIMDFIKCKDDNNKFNNFNISVGITNEFMTALWTDSEYSLVNPRTRKIKGRLKARNVLNAIVSQAWKNGEPGIVFLDLINVANPTPHIGEIESTNPCGEQPLLPYESCNLGSINLARMVELDIGVNWDRLKDTVWKAVHFLDNVIDVNKYPLPQIEEMTKSNRKIGLGIMGWADALIKLGVSYDSAEAITLAERVMSFIQTEARAASCSLAEERGLFPNYEGSIYDGRGGENGSIELRNATVTTIAPTGSLSILANCSSGIEPLYAVSFVKNVVEGMKLVEVNPYFEAIAKEKGFWSQELMEAIAKAGSVRDFSEVPQDVKALFVTAHDISPKDHVRMQAAFQKYVDNAVSKTINLRHDASVKDVEESYILAYKLGCRGVTVYRDGSRDQQVLSKGEGKKPVEAKPAAQVERVAPRKRPSFVFGVTEEVKTGCGDIYVTINMDDSGEPFEVFTRIGKAGGCASSQSAALGRLTSLCLRSNLSVQDVIKQLKGISCHQPGWDKNGRVLSCADAIGKALVAFIDRKARLHELMQNMVWSGSLVKSAEHPDEHHNFSHMGACPECGGAVEPEGGCAVCHNCGFTKC